MIEIPEVLREVWNFLVMHKIEVMLSILIAILFGVFSNYIWDWLKRKRDERRRTVEFFGCKKTKKLMPEDFGIAEYRDYYYEREADRKIREALNEGKSILIIGRPKAGKTRAAYEAVKRLEGFKVVKFWEKLLETDKIPKSVKKGKNVLVFDDLNKFVDKLNLYEVIKQFKDMSKRFVVVATCRSGKEFEEAEKKFSDVLRGFERVELGDVSEEEAREVANETGIEFKSFDGTIGSLFLGLNAMRIRFEEEPEECRILFRVLKLLHDAKIFSPRKSLVEEIYRRKLERDGISANMSIESALKQLERDSFIFVLKLKEFQAIRERHESYLDFTGYSASVDDFHWLKEILAELKDAEGLFYLGNAFCDRELFESGIECYDVSLKLKECAEAYINRGIAYAKLNKHEQAIEDFSKAIALNPNLAEAYSNRGLTYAELNKHERAIEDYDRAIALNTNFAEAYNNRGNAYAELNKYERAIEDYDRAIELKPALAGAYNNRGFAYAKLNKHERAIEDYDRAIKLNPDFAEAYYNRGVAYAELNKHEQAIKDYGKAIELNPNDAEAYINRGLAYAKLNKHEQALEDFSKAIDLNPNFAEAYSNRGLAYAELNKYERAIEDYGKAIALNPDYAATYYNRGLAYAELNEHERAIKDYGKAIELNPNYAEAYINRGVAYAELNKYERAIEDFSKAIKLDPNYAEAYNNRGLVYAKLNKYERAIKDYGKAINLNPNYAEAYYNRGATYAELNKYEQAIEDYGKAIALNPDDAKAYNNRGVAYAELNKHEQALEDFSKAIALNPALAEAYGNRGIAYSEIHRYEESARNLKKAGILFLHSGREEDAVKTFSFCFKLRDKIENDDIVYCGLALFLITLNPDVIIALRKMQAQDETLRELLELTMRKLRKEDISEEMAVLVGIEKREGMMPLLELLKRA